MIFPVTLQSPCMRKCVKPSESRLCLTNLHLEMKKDPRGNLIREFLGHAVRFMGEFVVSALDGFSQENATQWNPLTG